MYTVLLYYHYTSIENPEAFATEHMAFCESLELLGRIIVAPEGLNGTVSGSADACDKYMEHLRNDPRFHGIEFKIDQHHTHAFNRLHVRVKPEIVHSGLRDPSVIDPTKKTGIHLSPQEFLDMKDEEDVVILDVRSNYETHLGRFKNAVTLDIDNFREFPDHINDLEAYRDKKILTYCTGGIKCEKASAYLLAKGFKDVYQLHGGIIKYAQEVQGKDFEGQCYVFDNRVAVPVNKVNPTVVSHCYVCGTPSERMVNCANELCNVHVAICPSCGDTLKGACSVECSHAPNLRVYDGTGYYAKPPIEPVVKKAKPKRGSVPAQ